MPKELSLEKAVEAYRKAVEIRPHFILYRYELARALARLDRKSEAAKHLRLTMTLTPAFEDDPAVLERCRKLLSRLD